MSSCNSCKYLFRDDSVEYFECTKTDEMTDEEYEEIEIKGCCENCQYYSEDCEDLYYD